LNEEASLIVIAEIAAALTGFSGIAAAFGRRRERPWTDDERDRLTDLLNHSGIALFAALLPLVFAQYGGFSPRLWIISSLLWAGCSVFPLVRAFLGIVAASTWPPRLYLPVLAFFAIFAFQIYNAAFLQEGWPYLLALLANLGFAFIQFMGLVNPASHDGAD